MASGSVWDPFDLPNGARLSHRFVLAPMTTDSSNPDGTVSAAELAYIARRAATGFAAVITSCAYVHPDGRAWQGIGATGPHHLASLREVGAVCARAGGIPILQVYDGGRLASPVLVPPGRIRAPSAIPSSRPNAPMPTELTGPEIEALVQSYADAALLGVRAGFGGVELHGANHYLLHQFFSPRSNRRDDRWGGAEERRMAFALAVTRRVRATVGADTILGFRLNPFEIEPDGFTLDESSRLADAVSRLGVDYVHISMDDFRKNSPQPENRDWTHGVASRAGRSPIAAISDAVGGRCAVVASGGIRTLEDAEQAMALGADLLAVGRAALVDPEWLVKIRTGTYDEVRRFLPGDSAEIEDALTVPLRMARYLLSRPGWIPTLASRAAPFDEGRNTRV